MKTTSVTVRVPASTSNLGSGFDTLGLALELYNTIRVRIAGKGVVLVGRMGEEQRAGDFAMARDAAKLFFRRTRRRRFGIEVVVQGEVPAARGLGYSATVRVGVVAALNKLAGARLDRDELLQLATALEGHPDNASPAIFGGFTVSGMVKGEVCCLHFPVSPKARFVVLIPRFKISTKKALRLMPSSYSKADTAHALSRASVITAAFAGGELELLRGMFDDRVHQPYRERLIPQLSKVIRAGEKAGAIGGFLSGSGSSIVCVTLRKGTAVANAMQRQLSASEIRALPAANRGFEIVR
jgi:homoserine kinase